MKAIFFDLDGVLIVSEPDHCLAWQKAVSSLNLSYEIHYNEVVGIADEDIANTIINKIATYSQEELLKEKQKHYDLLMERGFSSPRGRDQFLKCVKKEYPLMIVSSSSRREIECITKKEKIDHFFDFIIGSEDVKRHKPFPDPYLLALEKSGFDPQDVIVIEDSPVGVTAAVSANLQVIGLATMMDHFPKYPKIKFYKDYFEIAKHLKEKENFPGNAASFCKGNG